MSEDIKVFQEKYLHPPSWKSVYTSDDEATFNEADYDLLPLIKYIIRIKRLSEARVLERAGLEPRFIERLARKNGMKNIGTRKLFQLCMGLAIHPYHFFELLYQQKDGNRKYRPPRHWHGYPGGMDAITNRMMLDLVNRIKHYTREGKFPYHDLNKDAEITLLSFMRTAILLGTTFQDAYILLLGMHLGEIWMST